VTGPFPSIAIVGVALRFPAADDALDFHDLTLSGKRRFRLDRGVALDEPVPGMRAGQAPEVTPWHRLAARTAAESLADASLDPSWTRDGDRGRARAGVLIAAPPRRHGQRTSGATPGIGEWTQRRLGLPAPEQPQPDQGCSLRAVAAACEALARGEHDVMLAGGAGAGAAATGIARKRDIRVYDARPTGIVRGEGCGIIALMRATDARGADLPIYAEIAGWSRPADGDDQPAVIRAAYQGAGVDPADVQLIEGHGAATAADDLAELTALLEVLGPRPQAAPRGGCALGAVSASIGNTGAAAGVAALLKTALAMAAATIPPSIGCVDPHELLREQQSPFRMPHAPEEWPQGAALLAGVNSLGVLDPARSAWSGPTHLVLRREQEVHRPGRRRRPRPYADSMALAGAASQASSGLPGAAAASPGSQGASLPHLLVRRALARHSTEVRKLLSLGLMGSRGPRD
jgi:acyl transferase domain-containing protein